MSNLEDSLFIQRGTNRSGHLKDILSVEPELYSEMHNLLDNIREEGRKQEEVRSEWPLEGLCDHCGAFADLLKVEKIFYALIVGKKCTNEDKTHTLY